MSKPILAAAVVAAALLTCTGAVAETPEVRQIEADNTHVAVRNADLGGPPCSITQNLDPDTLVDGTSVACADGVTTENSWYRVFDLDGDHGVVAFFDLSDIDWGIQSVAGTGQVEIKAYCLDDGLPFLLQFLILIGETSPIDVAYESLVFHNDEIEGGCETATQAMVVEIHAEDCAITGCNHLYVGMNDLGQIAPTYMASASCNIIEPTDLSDLGFPNAHVVMVLNGYGGCDWPDDGGADDGGGGDVPATTGVGAVLLLLILLGSGAYFLRRRVSL